MKRIACCEMYRASGWDGFVLWQYLKKGKGNVQYDCEDDAVWQAFHIDFEGTFCLHLQGRRWRKEVP
jgi:hypothetical protein